MATKTLAK